MRTIGNFLWLICGGLVMGIAWWLVGFVAFVSIVGIPWARGCFVIGKLMFLPFGREAIGRDELYGRGDIGTGPFGLLGNIVWFLFAGLWLAIGHLLAALFGIVTIIGIPFAIQHLKLAGLALAPIGKAVVSKDLAHAARRYNAEVELYGLRRAR